MGNFSLNIDKTYVIIACVVIVLIFILYKLFNKKTENYEDDSSEGSGVDKIIDQLIEKENEENPITSPDIENDMNIKWKNQAKNGKYTNSSYIQGLRGNDENDDILDTYNTRLADSIDYSNMNDNDKFVPVDESKNQYSAYQQKRKTKYTTDELFNDDKLLPQEVNKDWFETMPDPIKVKNRHLININKPFGTDTIGSSLKNASRDIRGNIPAPKFVVSPFLNSSIEPDLNTKGFCN
jgi:c-di-AMP phosphodiesterase-like protein